MSNSDDMISKPDFQELEDRIIAPAPKGPFIGIKTNLDEKTELRDVLPDTKR